MNRTGDDERVPELIVVSGPPGVGKTTIARRLSNRFTPSACVAGDEFFGFIDQGYEDPWTPAAHRQNEVVIDAAAAAVGRLVAGGYTVVYDGVIGPWFIDQFARAANVNRVHYAVILPSERTCLERVATRTDHGFTDLDAAAQMYRQFAETVDQPDIIDGEGDVATVLDLIERRVRNGSLTRTVSTPEP